MIRPAHPDELPALCQAMAAIEPWSKLELSTQRLLEACRTDPRRQAHVFERDQQILGVIMFRDHDAAEILLTRGFGPELARIYNLPWPCRWQDLPAGGYVNALAVFPGHRNQNIGLALLRHAENACYPQGRIYLCVSQTNPNARRFYERNGYTHIASVDNCLRPGNTEQLMTKPLPPLP